MKDAHGKVLKTEQQYKRNYRANNQAGKDYMAKWESEKKFIFRRDLDSVYIVQQTCQDLYGTKACKASVKSQWMDDRGDNYRTKFFAELKRVSKNLTKNYVTKHRDL